MLVSTTTSIKDNSNPQTWNSVANSVKPMVELDLEKPGVTCLVKIGVPRDVALMFTWIESRGGRAKVDCVSPMLSQR